MKRILSIVGIFIASFFFSAFAQSVDNRVLKDSSYTHAYIKEMTTRMFIKEVYDYRRKSTPWSFRGKKPAVLVFYADWCAPCQRMSPIIAQLASEYNNQVRFYKINIDKEKDLVQFFKATYIPLFIFIPMKDEPLKYNGTMDKEFFKEKIEDILHR